MTDPIKEMTSRYLKLIKSLDWVEDAKVDKTTNVGDTITIHIVAKPKQAIEFIMTNINIDDLNDRFN